MFLSVKTLMLVLVVSVYLLKNPTGASPSNRSLSSRSCPQAEFIYPCTCRMTAFGMHVVCIRIPTATALARIFSVLRDYETETLLLQETNLTPADNPADLFRGLRVLILRLVDCTLPASVRRALKSQIRASANAGTGSVFLLDGLAPALRRIDILHCNLGPEGLSTLGLARLPLLNEINVNRERLTTVKKSWFSNGNGTRLQRRRIPSNIQVLRIEQSGIASLEDNALGNLAGIVVLSLAKNSINSLKRNAFPTPAESLQTIDLSSNALTDLNADFFEAMPNLKKIFLYKNNLRTISQITWSPVWNNLETLWINDNPVVCDNTVSWLVESMPLEALEGACVEPPHLDGVHLAGLTRALLATPEESNYRPWRCNWKQCT